MSALPAIVEARDPQPAMLPEITKQKIIDYLTAFGLVNELSEAEKAQFIEIACEYRLNPYKREIYCIPFSSTDGKKLSIIVGYETYIKRAERSGRLDGWKAWIEGSGDDMKAVVEIYRKDWTHPFYHECFWREVAQRKRDGGLTAFWLKQPKFQLKKVAISQGFRMCFSDELGGIPYDPAELSIDQSEIPEPRLVNPPANDLAPATAQPVTPHHVIGIPPTTQSVPQEPPAPQASTIREGAFTPFNPSSITLMDAAGLKSRIQKFLDEAEEVFTTKHREWVLDKADDATGLEELRRLVGYVEKTIRQARSASPNI